MNQLNYNPPAEEEVKRAEIKQGFKKGMKRVIGIAAILTGLTLGLRGYNNHRPLEIENNIISQFNPYRNKPQVIQYNKVKKRMENLENEATILCGNRYPFSSPLYTIDLNGNQTSPQYNLELNMPQ